MNFLHFFGDSFYCGKTVAVYGDADGDTRTLCAETTSGRPIPDSRVVTLSRDEYAALREHIVGDALSNSDVQITWRALGLLVDEA